MRFFHLSDLHIGLRLFNYDLGEDQEYILDEICERAKERQPDAVIVAGDIYDKAVPSADAAALFDRFISRMVTAVPEAEIMMISGNHDSAPRVNVFRSVLEHHHIHMVGIPPVHPDDHIEKVTLTDRYGDVNFYLLPFVKPSMVKEIAGLDENGNIFSYNETIHRLIEREEINPEERNVLVSHQFYLPSGESPDEVERMDSEIRTVGNIDAVGADILDRFDYAALGHIHKPMKVNNDFQRYCGTPLACSVSEAGQQKGIIEVELKEKGRIATTVLPLTPLRQVRVLRGPLEAILRQACGDYVTVILTDKEDLDIFDTQDRLRYAFPRLLEIRRETVRSAGYSAQTAPERELDPFELCSSFLGDLNPEEQDLLREVINEAQTCVRSD